MKSLLQILMVTRGTCPELQTFNTLVKPFLKVLTYMSVCVCPAAAGRLGRRCHRRHLCGRQQQVQTDGLWLRQVLFFFFLSSFSRTTSESQFWVDAFVSMCYREQSLPVWCVCVLSKTLSVCVCTGRLVCACQKVLLDSAVCQSAGTRPPPPPQSPSFLFFLV